AWNEWAEGSYLEPDTEFEYGFLEAVRKVFK
ncbi:MAG: glycoside hydrolase family 99-like domain-containing protein, partial [Tannerella sp.]|nr:glycoside hydrolase family 99-like domain-containing protein [Tannerella sp.]